MTVPDLINDMLRRIRSLDHYHGREREFMRDLTALQRAIARYGYACHERGWAFEPPAILADLVALLRKIVEQNLPIKYFPLYLEGAIDRHVRTRAEELNAQAKAARSVPRLAAKAVAGVPVVSVVVTPSATEMLAVMYRDLKARRHRKRPAGSKAVKQGVLL